MRRLRSSKLWLDLRHGKPQNHDPPRRTTTIGNGLLPIELLQLIFAHLDIFTLLQQCRQVCRFWTHCIPGASPALHTILFLPRSKPPSPAAYIKPRAPLTLSFSVALYGPFVNSRRHRQRATGYTVRLLARPQTEHMMLNPLLFLDTTRTRLKRYKASWNTAVHARPLWTTMFVCDPPVRQVSIRVGFEGTDVPSEECAVTPHGTDGFVESATGVTMGQLLSALHDVVWWPRLSLEQGGLRVRVCASVNGERYGDEGDRSDLEDGG